VPCEEVISAWIADGSPRWDGGEALG